MRFYILHSSRILKTAKRKQQETKNNRTEKENPYETLFRMFIGRRHDAQLRSLQPGETTSSSAADSSAADTSSESESTASGDLSGIVKTGGSTSVEKVMNALIYKFQENNQNVTINYEMNGSGDAFRVSSTGNMKSAIPAAT